MSNSVIACLFCNRDTASIIDKSKNLYSCYSCSSTFYIERKNTNNFQTKINYFITLLHRMSFNITEDNYECLPKQNGNIFKIFYTQNNGIGLTKEERDIILLVYTKYIIFLQKNNIYNYSSSTKLILHSIINLDIIDKKFFVKTNEQLPLWYKFTKTFFERQSSFKPQKTMLMKDKCNCSECQHLKKH